ncbi:acyltransferase family protein [Brevibacillus daliensis]|uniref:acyltransferase family protein n=1 Tax=Brevibacillus daliensis TaxID=2892995 RepID=UPI001E6099FE|nr:acyltransferase [Brevibacillus daliensis]
MDSRMLKSLFVLQLFSSFLVFAGHYTALVLNYNDSFWVAALNQLSRYGTVILAIITGYFTVRVLDRKNLNGWNFFSGKIIYIFIPFILCGVLYHYLLNLEMPATATDFANILLGKTGSQLYFIFMLFQYYVFAYLFRNVITKKNILYLILPFMVIQYVYINYLHQPWLGLTTRHILPSWIFTFYLGHIIYWYQDVIIGFMKKHLSVVIGLTAFSVGSAIMFVLSETIYVAVHLRFVIATLCTLLIVLFFLINWADQFKLKFQKGLTFFIYLTHSAVMILSNKYLIAQYGDISWIFQNTWYTIAYLLTIYAVTFMVSLLFAKVMGIIDKGRKRLGQMKPQQQQQERST